MERGSKRKAALATSPTIERSAKRQKTPVPESAPKTFDTEKQQVNDVGLRYVARVKVAKDKEDNLIANDFLTLPSRSQFSDYYAQTPQPIALDIIKKKAETGQYTSVADIEADAKRMIQNAKDYNEPASEIYLNAERMRKITFNFMKQNNPAYGGTVTPGPDKTDGADERPQKSSGKIRLRPSKDAGSNPAPAKEEEPVSRQPSDNDPEVMSMSGEFKGKTFQQAQERVVAMTMEHTDEGGDLTVFQPFHYLPPRKLVDYYQTIKQPTSLNGVWKKVRGISGARGKEVETGQTEFRSWDAFENEFKKIWENARTYNEDGSEMDVLSQELETFFYIRLKAAKKNVNEPPQPTLKLNMSKSAAAPIKLKLGSQKPSPAPAAADQTTAPATSSTALPAEKTTNGAPPVPVKSTSRPPSQAGAIATVPAINGVKAESHASTPPVTDQAARPVSQQGAIPGPAKMVNGASHAVPSAASNHASSNTSSNGFDNKFRQDGRDASTALISNVQVITHPSLQLPPGQKHLNISVPAHKLLTQQNITLNLPPTQTHIQLYPSISPFISSNRNRPFRLFVTSNGQRLNPSNVNKPPAEINGAGINGSKGPPPNGYDVRLNPGMNRLEVECVAVAEGALGAGTLAGKGGLEMERIGVYVHSLRA